MKSNKNMQLYIAVDIAIVLVLIVAAIIVNSRIKSLERDAAEENSAPANDVIVSDNSAYVNADNTDYDKTDSTEADMNNMANDEDDKMDTVTETVSGGEVAADFEIKEIDDAVMARIYGKSYPADYAIDKQELRYLKVKHVGFDGLDHSGEIIVNAAIAEDVLDIFKELYDIGYRIEKIRLIDEYDADDEKSMEDNNSSAFNYRYIAETEVLSNHALGLAIDINTLYNPYVYTRKDGSLFLQPVNAADYVDRNLDNPYFIKKGDACYNIFIKHGFTWGGDWNTKKDYQHFEYKK